MNILVAGASVQTHASVARIARSLWIDVTLVQLARGVGATVPAQTFAASRCDLCVLDVMGLGWSPRFPEHATRVETLLADRSAILLLPPECGGGWLDAPAFSARHNRLLLRRRISPDGFRDAMWDAGETAAQWAESAYLRHLYCNVWMRGSSAMDLASDLSPV